MAVERQGTIDLKVSQSGDAEAKLKGVAAAANNAAAAEKKLQEQAEKGSAFAGLGGKAGGAAGKAAGGAAGGPGGAIATAYLATAAAAGKLGDAMNILQDGTKSSAQKMNALADEFVPGAKQFRTFMDALSGTTERIARSNRQFDMAMARQAADAQRRQALADVARGRNEGLAGAAGVRSASYGAYAGTGFDRSTVGGQQGRADALARQEADDAVTRAQRKEAAARSAARMQQGRLGNAQEEQDWRSGRRKTAADAANESWAKENRTGYRRKAERTETLNDASLKNTSEGNAITRTITEATAAREAELRAINAEADTRKALVDRMKAEIAIVEARSQRMSEGQKRVGGMNEGQYQLARTMAEAVKRNGIENSTPDMIEIARTIAPRMIDQLAENRGAGRAKDLADRGIDDFATDYAGGRTLKGNREQEDKLRAEARVSIDLNEQAMADAIVAKLDPVLKALVSAINVRMENATRQAAINMARLQNGNN